MTNRTPSQLDRLLLEALPPPARKQLQQIWMIRNLGMSNGLDMYKVPTTPKQAALLFSHDWSRAAATMEWFAEVVGASKAGSLVEMGCGAGFLLGYLQQIYPELQFQGVDEAENLAGVATQLLGQPVLSGDFLSLEPDGAYDTLLCDFGFDLARFKPSSRPHAMTSFSGAPFCASCSEDFGLQFDVYARAWQRWVKPSATLAFAGRLPNFGYTRAIVLALRNMGWTLSAERSRMLTVTNIEKKVEQFPAMVFEPGQMIEEQELLKRAVGLHSSALPF